MSSSLGIFPVSVDRVHCQSEFYTILDWNYKIATDKNSIWEPEFRQACAKRVQEMMTPPVSENQENKENNEQ